MVKGGCAAVEMVEKKNLQLVLHSGEDDVAELRGGGNSVSAFDGDLSFPVDEHSARFGDNGHEGGCIPGVQQGVNHDFGPTCGNQHVSVAITPATGDACRPAQVLELVEPIDGNPTSDGRVTEE